MKHPFISDLSDKTTDELQKTISSLTGKLIFAGRTHNVPLYNQLLMALESYKDEYARKMNELFDKQNASSQINIEKYK